MIFFYFWEGVDPCGLEVGVGELDPPPPSAPPATTYYITQLGGGADFSVPSLILVALYNVAINEKGLKRLTSQPDIMDILGWILKGTRFLNLIHIDGSM